LVIYLDSSALVKLVAPEVESAALVAWLADRPDEPQVSSALVEVEVPRALRRSTANRLGAVAPMLVRLERFDIDAPVRATAGAYVDPLLRSLDAIHLATAENLVASGKSLGAFVTYDKRLAVAAADAGFTVVAPGGDV
jgi:uncharacterized protein